MKTILGNIIRFSGPFLVLFLVIKMACGVERDMAVDRYNHYQCDKKINQATLVEMEKDYCKKAGFKTPLWSRGGWQARFYCVDETGRIERFLPPKYNRFSFRYCPD